MYWVFIYKEITDAKTSLNGKILKSQHQDVIEVSKTKHLTLPLLKKH